MMGINDLNLLRHHRVDYTAQIDRDGSGRSPARPNLARVVIAIAGIGVAFLGVAGL